MNPNQRLSFLKESVKSQAMGKEKVVVKLAPQYLILRNYIECYKDRCKTF